MRIKKTNSEDLAMLKLFVNKLEEELSNKDIDCFCTNTLNETIENIRDPQDYASFDGVSENRVMKKYVKLKRICFNSNGIATYWKHHFSTPTLHNHDSGGSTLEIEWDHFTNVFNVTVSVEETRKSATGLLDKSYQNEVEINWDFGYENRRDIQLIKIRLGKLFKKISEYRDHKNEMDNRKALVDLAVKAFPDFVDSLILGGSDEKRDI